jgi:hypothetical protein
VMLGTVYRCLPWNYCFHALARPAGATLASAEHFRISTPLLDSRITILSHRRHPGHLHPHPLHLHRDMLNPSHTCDIHTPR